MRTSASNVANPTAADFAVKATNWSTHWPAPLSWEAPVRFRVILAAAAFALAGCNANQAINPCGRDPDCNPYDPTSYAQNQTGIGGGGH
jgi:hypothetical protein